MQDTTQEFSVNERPREYKARFSVEGKVTVTIFADSMEEAKAKADAMLEDDDFGCEIDDVFDARVCDVYRHPPMYRVMRNGKPMQTSRIQDGDLPRDPDENGF